MTGINAGETEAVHEQTLATLHQQQLVEVNGQSDIMVVGIPYLTPYNVNSILNPILVHCMGLGYLFNMYRNKPVVRPGGAMIMFHPVPNEFHQVHHPSYVDFFEEVLSETTDPSTIESKYEERYATDPWYIHLYRKSYAYHGVHPFYMWYWGAHALDYLGDVIIVGGDPEDVRAARLPLGVELPGRARDGGGDRRALALDHVLPRAAARDRGRALMSSRSSRARSGTSPRAGAGAAER